MKAVYISLFYFLIPSVGISQIHLTGRIISTSTKAPLPGVTVQVKGTQNGTVSSSDGTFNITFPDSSATIVISSMGYRTTELSAPFVFPLIIALEEDPAELEAVIVSTGYEKIPRERATGSFTHIDNDLLNRSVSTGIMSRLKGVTNALSFDERRPYDPQIRIRGLSTIYSDQSPLIVLNNFPYEGDIRNINPNDVKSITILKDAAAASIWGVRAANGVIVITTKQGRLNQSARVSFTSNVTISAKPNVEYLPFISSADFIEVEEFLFAQDFYNSQETNPYRPPLTPVVELLIRQRDGVISAKEASAQIEALKQVDVRDDFNKYLYESAVNQQYSLNLQGGSDNISYYLSAGYDRNLDELDAQLNRLTLRSENTYSPVDQLQIHASIAYTQDKNVAGKPDYANISTGGGKFLYPYAQLADKTGNPLPLVKDYRYPFILNAEEKGLLNWEYFPLQDYRAMNHITQTREILLNTGFDFYLSNSLTIQAKYQYQHNSGQIEDFSGMNSYYARDLINRFTQVNEDGSFSYPVPMGGILDQTSSELSSQALRAQLRYQKSWGGHDLNVIAGGEVRELGSKSNSYRSYGYDEHVLTSLLVDYLTEYPMYYNPNREAIIPGGTGFSARTNRYTSIYGNAAYTYHDRYTLSVSARKDASNLFGVNANQRGVPLWSAGISWNVHNEGFHKSDWLEFLKLRFTYGYNGNLDKNLTAVTTIRHLSDYRNNRPFARISTYPNPDLRWEKVQMVNIGIDFRTREARLSGTVEYYFKRGIDLLGDAPIDPTAGLISGTIRRNIAGIKGQGFDVEIVSQNLKRSFKWSTALILNYNTNEVTELDSISTNGSYYVNTGLSVIPLEGKPLYNIFTYQWGGLDPNKGDPMGILNGQPSTDYRTILNETPVADLVFHGPALPPVFGSMKNTFTYKRFSLSANLTYRFGYYFKRSSISYSSLFNNWNGHSDFASRWKRPGDEKYTNVPSMAYPNNSRRDNFYQLSSILIEKGDHIRLQDINISYEISQKQWPDLLFDNLRVYLYAQNLGILWRANSRGLDPDYAAGYLPAPFTISFGLQANF